MLKAGSSAMAMSLATRLPCQSEKLRWPRVTRAAQGGGEARLDGGAEGLGVDEKRNRDEGEENEGGYSCDDLEPAFLHANLTAETV